MTMTQNEKSEVPVTDQLTYEEAIQRLESIVSLLEGSELPLDRSMDLFREGVALSSFCKDKLKSMKEEIVKLVDADGSTEPLL